MSSSRGGKGKEKAAPRRSQRISTNNKEDRTTDDDQNSTARPAASLPADTTEPRQQGSAQGQGFPLNAFGHPMYVDPKSRNSEAEFRARYHGIGEDAELPHFNQKGAGYAPSFRYMQVKAERERREEEAKAWLRDSKNQAALSKLAEGDDGDEEMEGTEGDQKNGNDEKQEK